MNRHQKYGPKPSARSPSFDFPFAQEGNTSDSHLQRVTNQLHEMSQPLPRSKPLGRASGNPNLPSRNPSVTQHSSRAVPATQYSASTRRRSGGFGARSSTHPMSQPAPKQPPSQGSLYMGTPGDQPFLDLNIGFEPQEEEDNLPFSADDTFEGLHNQEAPDTRSGQRYPRGFPAPAIQRPALPRDPPPTGPSAPVRGLQSSHEAVRPSGFHRPRTNESFGGLDMTEQQRLQKAEEGLRELEEEKRKLDNKAKDLESQLKRYQEKERVQDRALKLWEKKFQSLNIMLGQLQANSKNLKSMHSSTKEAIDTCIRNARNEFSAFKSNVETCRQDLEKTEMRLKLSRQRMESLQEVVSSSKMKDDAVLQELKISKGRIAESGLKVEKAISAQLAKDKEGLLKSVGGNGEAFSSALKSLHNSGLLSPNVISTMKTKIDSLEEKNQELRQESRAAERERHEAVKAKEKEMDARKVDQDKAVREVVRLQGELEECKRDAASVRDQFKEKEIRVREALAASRAAMAAMEISLNECKRAGDAGQEELIRVKLKETAIGAAKAIAEALATERQDRIIQITADLERAHKELDKLKIIGAKSSDMSIKYNDMATRYNEMEEKLATSKNDNLDLQRLVHEMEIQVLAHAGELVERDDRIEELASSIALHVSFEDFKARLDRNQLTEDEKGDWEKRKCGLENKIHQLQQQLKARRPESAKNTLTPLSAKTAKNAKPKTVVYGGKRRRVDASPEEVNAFSDEETQTKKDEVKKFRLESAKRRKATTAPEAEPAYEETLSDFALGAIELDHLRAPQQAPPPSQYPRNKGRKRH
ncbi:hypothetical protein CspHIS471_0604000 [Cutaneotrichosporon sp. HIS471]|nr:hypothetical protein CspHIS471_0604000 [Cutaneotrichosporon sp. HIS471]